MGGERERPTPKCRAKEDTKPHTVDVHVVSIYNAHVSCQGTFFAGARASGYIYACRTVLKRNASFIRVYPVQRPFPTYFGRLRNQTDSRTDIWGAWSCSCSCSCSSPSRVRQCCHRRSPRRSPPPSLPFCWKEKPGLLLAFGSPGAAAAVARQRLVARTTMEAPSGCGSEESSRNFILLLLTQYIDWQWRIGPEETQADEEEMLRGRGGGGEIQSLANVLVRGRAGMVDTREGRW